MTRIGHEGVGIIIVTHRKEGYFASILEPNKNIKINSTALGHKSLLLKLKFRGSKKAKLTQQPIELKRKKAS
jgi:hypothetical protein